MKKEKTLAPLPRIVTNDGRIPWLPKNPRDWTQNDLKRMKQSIEEDPDFLEDRPVLVVTDPATAPELADILVAFGGNLRAEGAKQTARTAVPVIIYQPETDEDRETIIRRALKDNGTFGVWDADTLANEWDVEPDRLVDWGVPEWITGGATEKHEDAGSGSGAGADLGEVKVEDILVNLTIGLNAEEYSFVRRKLSEAGETDREGLLNLLGYGQ